MERFVKEFVDEDAEDVWDAEEAAEDAAEEEEAEEELPDSKMSCTEKSEKTS